jgi:uncharacterized protein YjbJ (UPF0337 family)
MWSRATISAAANHRRAKHGELTLAEGSRAGRRDEATFCSDRRYPLSIGRRVEEFAVTWEELRGNWHTLGIQVQRQWDKLSNQDMDFIQGQRPQLEARLMERYGFTREQAETEVERWHSRQMGLL